jgi:hypothetical protein
MLARQVLEAARAAIDLALEISPGGAPRLGATAADEVRSRMWRARVWVTLQRTRPRTAVDQLEHVEAGAAAHQRAVPLAHGQRRTASTKRSGSRSAGRRPISPPRSRLASSESSRATAAKSSPARTRARACSARAGARPRRRRWRLRAR